MQVIVRIGDDQSLGIRASFHFIDETPGGGAVLYLNNVSEKGLSRLVATEVVRVEVLGMPSRVVFQTRIVRVMGEGVALNFPEFLISTERRQNTRYQTSAKCMGYLAFSNWEVEDADLSAPPVLGATKDLGQWCAIADISVGGICVMTRFPSIMSVVTPNDIDEKARLILPMMEPIVVPVQCRWQKRTIERINFNGIEHAQKQFRLGIEFRESNEQFVLKVRQFMRQLTMADAI